MPDPQLHYGTRPEQPILGKRVRVKFQVKESGKLSGKFDMWMDVDPEAARGLARTLNQLADEAEKGRLDPESTVV